MAGSFIRVDPEHPELKRVADENFKDAAIEAAFLSKWGSFHKFEMQSFERRVRLTPSDAKPLRTRRIATR